MGKPFVYYFSFNRYNICHSECIPFEHKGYGKKQCTSLSPRKIRRYIVITTMSRYSGCDTSVESLGFLISLGTPQHTYTGEKPYEHKEYGNSTVWSMLHM